MMFKKKSLLFLVIMVIVVGILIGFRIRDNLPYPENKFGIVGNESFYLTHLYNVNGVVGAEKTEFTAGERREIMAFLAKLDYKELLPTETETIYGVPVMLNVKKKDGSKIEILFYTDIWVREYDKDENVLSQNIYITGKKQRSDIYGILGIYED